MRLREFNGNDRNKSFLDIFLFEVRSVLFKESPITSKLVDDLHKTALKTACMSTAIDGVDVVNEGESFFVVGAAILERDLNDVGNIANVFFPCCFISEIYFAVCVLCLKVNDILIDNTVLTFRYLLNESRNAALIVIAFLPWNAIVVLISLIGEVNHKPTVKERKLLKATTKHAVFKHSGFKHACIRVEGNGCSSVLLWRFSDNLHLFRDMTTRELNVRNLAITTHFRNHLVRERVNDGHANAMKTA